MLRPRITPCLLVHQGGLTKTVRFTDHKYVGDPINAVKIFNEKQADELIVLDIDATVEDRPPDFQLIGHLALECRMPLCYGGGIKSAADAGRAVELGVEKVAISSAAVERPRLLAEMAEEIGRQSVVAVLDVSRQQDGYRVMTHNGRRDSGRDVETLAAELEELGAGEIVVNSIDRDGTMEGYDLELARRIRDAVSVPMTVLGGAGKLAHISELVATCGVLGAAAGSLFVFKGIYRAVLINYPSQARKERLLADAAAIGPGAPA